MVASAISQFSKVEPSDASSWTVPFCHQSVCLEGNPPLRLGSCPNGYILIILGVPKTCHARPFSAFLAVLASLSFSNLQICKGGVGFKSPSPHQITCFR